MYMNNHIIQYTTLEERRKEKKEERNEQTPTIYNGLKGLETYVHACVQAHLVRSR